MPDLIPYSAWGKPSDDKVQNLRDYADYVREEHFKEGSLLAYEQDIIDGIKGRAVKDGLVDPRAPEDDENNAEVIDRLFGQQQDSQDADIEYLKDFYAAEKDEAREGAIRRYQARKRVGNEEFIAQSLEEIAPFATKENIRDARRAAAQRGDVPFIAIEDEDDNGETFRYIYTAPDTEAPTPEERPSLLSKLRNEGAIQTSDLLRLEYELGSDPGETVPRFKAQRGRDFLNQIGSVLDNNKELNALISSIAQVESNTRSFGNDSAAWQGIKGTGQALMGGLALAMTSLASTIKTGIIGARGEGFKWGENLEKDLSILSGTGGLHGYERSIVDKLAASPLGEQFSKDELETYLGDLIKLNMAPKFDDDEPDRNFLKLSNGSLHAHEALLANPALHDEQVDSLEIGSNQKEALKAHRRMRLAATAPDQRKRIIKVFGAEAVDQLNEIKAAGGSDSDFVEAFLSDGDNFSKFKNSWGLIGSSVLWALPEGLAGLAQMGFQITEELGKTADHYGEALGSETLEVIGEETQSLSQSGVRGASSAIYGIQNFKGKYRERAELFGKGIGIPTEIATVIPQVAVDLLATKGIMSASKAAGKGLASAATKTAQKTKLNRLASTALAGKLSAKSKAWLGGNSGSAKFSKGVGRFADDMLKETIPLSIPAYSRSYSATYASIYNQLPDDMSHEEKHSHANGFSALSGLNTAAIMFGFAKVGAAGVEKLVMRGFSWKQMKLLYDDALNAGKVSSDATFASAVENSYKAAHRHFWVKALKQPLGEGAEESLDELGQGLIEAAALNEDVSLYELSQQVWHAGLIGAPLGLAGTAKTMGFKSTLEGTSIIEQVKAQNDFYSGIASRLTTAESPQTAATIRRLIEQNNRRASAEEEVVLPTPNRVEPGEVEPDGQLPFKMDDARGTRPDDPLRGVDQRGQELPLGDPRRAPEVDPAQLTFDFDGPPPNIDPATGEPLAQPLLLGEADDPAQARFDFRDPEEVGAVAEEATPGEEPFRTRAPESEATDPLLPGFDLDREQADLDFEGADATTPAPARSPEPESIRELVGRRANYGEYSGVVQIDPTTGEAVLVLHEPTESGATEVVLGSPNNPPTGIKTQNRLAALAKDTNGFPAGTPIVRVGKSRYALPSSPNIEAILDADGNPVGIMIRGAQRIEGGKADIEIRVKEKALEVLRYYGIDFGGLTPSKDGDPSIEEIQDALNLNPDADTGEQVEALIPDVIKPTLDEALDILEGEIEVDGEVYNILDAIDLIQSGNISDKAYVKKIAELPMEVLDAVRSRIEKAFDTVAEAEANPLSEGLAQTLIKLHSKYESRERVYLNYHQRRVAAEAARESDTGVPEPDAGGEPDAGVPEPDAGIKPVPVILEDPVSSPLTSAAAEVADPELGLELEFENAPKTEKVKGPDGKPQSLDELETLELNLTGIANNPDRKTEEREAARIERSKATQAKRAAQDKVKQKQDAAAAKLNELKRKSVPTPPSDEKTRKKENTKSKVDQIKSRGKKKEETKGKSVKVTAKIVERVLNNFKEHGELSEALDASVSSKQQDKQLEGIVVGLVSEATKVPESVVKAIFNQSAYRGKKAGGAKKVIGKTFTGEPATTKADGNDVTEIERQRDKKEEAEAAKQAELWSDSESEVPDTTLEEGGGSVQPWQLHPNPILRPKTKGLKSFKDERTARAAVERSHKKNPDDYTYLKEEDGRVVAVLSTELVRVGLAIPRTPREIDDIAKELDSNYEALRNMENVMGEHVPFKDTLTFELIAASKADRGRDRVGGIKAKGPKGAAHYKRHSAEYDGSEDLPAHITTAIYNPKGDVPSTAADRLHRENIIEEATPDALWAHIKQLDQADVDHKNMVKEKKELEKATAEKEAQKESPHVLEGITVKRFKDALAKEREAGEFEEKTDSGEEVKKKTAKKKAAKKEATKKAAKKRGRPKKVKLSSAELESAKLNRKKGKDFEHDGTWEYKFEGDSRVFKVYFDRVTRTWKDPNATREDQINYQDILGNNVNDLEASLRARAVVAAERDEETPGDEYKDDEFRNEAEKVSFLEAVKSGFLVRDLANILPGFRKSGKKASTYNKRKADYLENQVFETYPKTESFLSKKEKRDLQEGYEKEKKVTGRAYRKAGTAKKDNIPIPVKRDAHEEVLSAYFTNDPREAADAILKGISIFVPKKFIKLHNDPKSKFRVNESIKFNDKSGEIQSVQLNPAEPPIVPGFRKRAKSDFRLRIFEKANAFGRQLFDITSKDHPVQHATLQKLNADMFVPTGDIPRLEKAFSILFKEKTGVTLNEDFVTLLYNVTYVETSLRLKEVEIAKEIKAAVSRVDARRGEGEPLATVEDLGVDVIPNIIRRKFLKDKSNEGEFLDVLSGYLDVPKGATPESMMNKYGKDLLGDLKSNGRFPHGLVPDAITIARVMGSNLPAAQKRREAPEVSMEEEGVAAQVSGTATEVLSERVVLENEYNLEARSVLIRDRLVELMDADTSPTGVRFHFNTIGIKAGFLDAADLKPGVLIDQIKNYLLTADQATPEGRVAKAFELALAETEAGREAMMLLIEAGVIPVDSTRAEAISEIIREDSSFDNIDEILFRLNRLENEQSSFDSKASDDPEITEAALGENKKEAAELGLVSGDASSVVDALIQIKRTSDNPVHREVADLLLLNPELITDVEFRIVEAPTAEFAGRFFPEENMVILNLARSNGRGLADALMHEYLHANTISALTNPQNARQRAAIQRMDNLRKLAADQARKQGLLEDPDFVEMYEDAFNSNVEFLTYMLTDTRFQSVLQSVSVPGQKSFLRKIADTVIRALGFNPNDNKMSAKEQAITELLDFTRMVSEPGLFGVSEKTARIEQRKHGLSILERTAQTVEAIKDRSRTRSEARDVGYLAAVEAGDLDTAQQLFNEAANDAGFGTTAYHVTDEKFTRFDPEKSAMGQVFWFTESKKEIESAETGAGLRPDREQQVMEVLLKAENPAGRAEYENLGLGQIDDRGYDSVKLEETWVVFNSNQIKSTDLITRDENGGIIPPSKRFDSGEDIRGDVTGDQGADTPSRIPETPPTFFPGEADALSNPELMGTSIGYDQIIDPYEAPIDVVEYAKEITPAGFEVAAVEDGPAAFTMVKYPGVIFVNPSRLAAAVDGMSEQNAQNMVESIISEELAHLAGLQAIPSEQEIEFIETTSEAQLLRWLENYAQGVSEEKRQAFIEERMRLIREAGDDLTPKLNILREHLRATLQRATRGTTTEEDVAFYRNNPGHWAVIFRYLKKAFTVLKTRIGLKFNPRLAGMVDQMRREVVRMNNGGRLRDKVSRIIDGNYDINFADLNSMLATSVGATVNFEDTLEIFDLPIALAQGTGDYDDGGRISRLFRKSGDIDPRLKEVDEVRSQMVRMIGQRMDSRAKKFRKLLNKLYGGSENAPSDIISTAFGSNEPLLTQADFDAAEQKFDVDYALIEHAQTVELAKAGLLRSSGDPKAAYALEKKWWADKAARIKTANANKEADLNQRAIKNAASHKSASRRALASLPNELAAEISAMRAEIDNFSTKVQELDGNMTARMKGVFDRNKGIYITRSYKLFTEPGFAEQMASDPSYKTVRDDAAKFFRPILIKQWTEHYLKTDTTGTLTKADATIMAENHVNNNNLDQKAVEDFLARYDGDANGHAKSSTSFKLDLNRFMMKGNVPTELRALMGEETDPFKNAFRTYANVGLMASNMNFLNEFTRAGMDGGFIVDRATVNSDPVKYKDYRVIKPSAQKAFHPLNGMYAPKALIDTMDAMFSGSQVLEKESSRKAMEKVTEVVARATGLSLGMKTLGSVGFFIRNFLSNLMFFGPMQGYIPSPRAMQRGASIALAQWKGNTNDYLSHLISLGVVGDDVRSNVLNDMIRGKAEDPAVMQQKLQGFSDSLFDKAGAIQSLNDKTLGKTYKFLQGMSVAIDAFHKIGLYEYELSVLKKAYPNKPKTELEQLAADKVKMTAQSYSQAPPLVRDFTRSGLGLVIAPFARFKGEVFRVGINTIRLGISEMRSGNSVLRRRGIQRLSGFAFVIGGLSTAFPYILQATMAGMSDEEEEAYRAGLPEYAKNNTYYFFKVGGKVWAIDLTYTNPFALVVDPILRSIDAARTGRTDEIADIGGRALFQQFFSEQIAFKAASSWAKNYDEQSGRPIYNDAAPFHEKFTQGFGHFLKKAYAPRTYEKLRDARALAKMPDLTDEEGKALAGNAAATNLLLMEFLPSKPHPVDPDKLAGRYLRSTFRQYSELRSELGKLKSSRPMSGEEVAEIYANNVKDRVRMMNKLRRISRGYESMGIDMGDFARKMISSGFSKSRARGILFRGVLDRPVPAKETVQTILRVAPEGRDRMDQYYDAVRSEPRFIELE